MPRVLFQPGLRAVDVDRGERLLVAAWRAGVALKSVCGGRGKCGTCLVEVEAVEGTLSAPHGDELVLLPESDSARTLRLACMAYVLSDVTVTVPPESEAVRAPPRKPYSVARVPAAPVVSQITVDVAGAYDLPQRPLAVRIEQALRGAGAREAHVPAPVLADFSHEPQFDAARRVTATLFEQREAIRLRA